MLHLPADRLAELVDTEPTADECAHLEVCSQCERERAAYATLRRLSAAESERESTPLLTWEELRPSLVEQGILSMSPAFAPRTRRFAAVNAGRIALRVAASFALVAGGVAAGRYTARTGAPPVAAVPAAATPDANAQLASNQFQSREAAMRALVEAQSQYQRAAAFLVASDTTVSPNAPHLYRERLAALDEVMGVTRNALARAPHDPVINSYYLATLGAREATLQQLQLSLPEGTRIERF